MSTSTAIKIAVGVTEVITSVAITLLLDKSVVQPSVAKIMTPIKNAAAKRAA